MTRFTSNSKAHIKTAAMVVLLLLLLFLDGCMSCYVGEATKNAKDMSWRVLLYVFTPLLLGLLLAAKWKKSWNHFVLLRWSCWILLVVALILAIVVVPKMDLKWKTP